MAQNNFGNRFVPGTSPAVLNLLIINGLVFLSQLVFQDVRTGLTEKLALWPPAHPLFKPYQLITHMFLHSGFINFLFFLIALWSIGSMLERIWGTKKFLLFYLLCGLLPAALQILITHTPVVGPVASMMGIFAAYVYLFPDSQLIIFPIPFPVKAKWAVLVSLGLYIFLGILSGTSLLMFIPQIAGFITGILLSIYWKNK